MRNYLALIDACGLTMRVQGTQGQGTAVASLRPAGSATFYAMHKNWSPVFCMLVVGVFGTGRFWQRRAFRAMPFNLPGASIWRKHRMPIPAAINPP